ncbi:MAG: secondary thiamine-phosphate synthase [Halobacteriovoraceae bacterium]|nr:secondary thiamine-phosphate synthase [Halobacteriovoraceae bacterium]|tara:strand:- start:11724 stop:12134 length:411 start_codon:yes stop_codon:yes gene_type:complete
MVSHKNLTLRAYRRGFHLITDEILQTLGKLPSQGILTVFIQHTSAALTLNENCDPSVLADFESSYNRIVPEGESYYTHTAEGPDDMPAHIKSSLTGTSLSIPIIDGKLALGTWQGVYLCEFRNQAGPRKLIVSIYQ